MIEKYVGETISGYKIIQKTDKKDSSGHFLYKCSCKFCNSFELRSIRTLKQQKGVKCPHFDKFGFLNFSYKNAIDKKRLIKIFNCMKKRCYDANRLDYKWYGGKGIKICNEWLNDPNAFVNWALLNGYKESLTIDRIDENGNYEPNNCRWISLNENSRRAGNVNWITINGETLTGRQWAKKINKSVNYVNNSIRKNGLAQTICKIKNFL